MKKYIFLVMMVVSVMFCAAGAGKSGKLSDETLRRYAAQMLMVGFKGDSIDENSDAVRYVRDLHVGGIILFDVDLTGSATIGSRNITSKEQLAKLTSDLRRYAGYDLLIAVDQEGGLVCRLKEQYGFQPTVSAEYLGEVNNRDTTYMYGERIAREMAEVGLNVNLAPLLDVNVNKDCPVIGKLHRSFSSDVQVVADNAGWFIDAHHAHGVLCSVKHFPGHGSATADSHYGLTDVSDTWKEEELEPFRQLIKADKVDMIMTAHIFNRQLDKNLPATLSKDIIQGVLRDKLGFNGVVMTDDMYMQGIIDHYSIKDAVVLAINAGADILVMGNNISTGFEPDRPFHIVDMIVEAVKDGKISEQRLIESHNRIEKLLKRLK